MRIGDWLYGPVASRAHVLDLDTLREFAQAIRDAHPAIEVTFFVKPPTGDSRKVSEADLDGLSVADLGRLSLDARMPANDGAPVNGPVVGWNFARDSVWGNAFRPIDADGTTRTDEPLTLRLRQIINDSSRPLRRRRRFHARAAVALVPAVLIITGVVWLELTTPLLWPVHVAAWGVVLLAFMVTRPVFRVARMDRLEEPPVSNGHRVLSETRADTAARRADRRRDVKIAAFTFVATLAASILTAVILYFALGIGAR